VSKVRIGNEIHPKRIFNCALYIQSLQHNLRGLRSLPFGEPRGDCATYFCRGMNLFASNDKEALRVIPVAEYWGRVLANARSRGSTRMLSNASATLSAPPSSKSWARALLSTIIGPLCTSENNGAELKSRYLDINSGTQIKHISSS